MIIRSSNQYAFFTTSYRCGLIPGITRGQPVVARADNNSYRSGARLVEINSHSLFSKWFSESGKLVQKLFSTITAMVQDPDCFVFVMIDEVESLTAARSGMSGGNEPGDAIRVSSLDHDTARPQSQGEMYKADTSRWSTPFSPNSTNSAYTRMSSY
jgi:hypothetical protein